MFPVGNSLFSSMADAGVSDIVGYHGGFAYVRIGLIFNSIVSRVLTCVCCYCRDTSTVEHMELVTTTTAQDNWRREPANCHYMFNPVYQVPIDSCAQTAPGDDFDLCAQTAQGDDFDCEHVYSQPVNSNVYDVQSSAAISSISRQSWSSERNAATSVDNIYQAIDEIDNLPSCLSGNAMRSEGGVHSSVPISSQLIHLSARSQVELCELVGVHSCPSRISGVATGTR